MDRLQHLSAFADTHTAFVRDIRVPDRVFSVEANTVWNTIDEIGPYAPVRQTAVRFDIKCRELFAIGFGHDQRRIVWRYSHAIRKGDTVSHLASCTVGSDQCDDSRSEFFTGHKIKATAVDVDIAATVHDNFIKAEVREMAQVSMLRQRSICFPSQQKLFVGRDDKETSVGQEVDAHRNRWEWHADDDLAPALGIDGEDLLCDPVGEPQPSVVPTWRFAEGDTSH